MEQPITYAGLDVHKETIAVAIAEAGCRSSMESPHAIAPLAHSAARPSSGSHKSG
jgi:hypothetical protein